MIRGPLLPGLPYALNRWRNQHPGHQVQNFCYWTMTSAEMAKVDWDGAFPGSCTQLIMGRQKQTTSEDNFGGCGSVRHPEHRRRESFYCSRVEEGEGSSLGSFGSVIPTWAARTLVMAVILACMPQVSVGKVMSARLDTTLRRYSDVYLGAFTFSSQGGKIKVNTNTNVRGQRFLFFDGTIQSWPLVLANYQELSCLELRNISLMVTQDEESQSLSEGLAVPLGTYHADLELSATPKPSQWFTLLSNCDNSINLSFTITFLNPGGWWYQHFTVDEQGMLGMFMGWTLMYAIGCCAYAYAQYELYRSQSLHPVCHMITAGIVLEFANVLLQSIHGAQYASDGVGLVAVQGLGEVCDAVSNAIIMLLLILLAQGWTTTSSGAGKDAPDVSRAQMMSMGMFVTGFFSLYVIERMGRALDERYCYDSDLGVFVLVLRTWVYVYFVLCVSRSKALEETAQRRAFLSWFSAAGGAWFMGLPASYFASQFLNSWDQMKLVISMGVFVHTLGLVGLAALTWPRSKNNEYVTITREDITSGSTPYDEI